MKVCLMLKNGLTSRRRAGLLISDKPNVFTVTEEQEKALRADSMIRFLEEGSVHFPKAEEKKVEAPVVEEKKVEKKKRKSKKNK